MPLLYKDWFNRKEIEADLYNAYVFGDNCLRQGYGGQAKECRNAPNAYGIRTKFRPDMKPDAFFSDDKFEMIKAWIDEDFKPIEFRLRNKGTVFFPRDGLGTGLSKLPEKAPKVFAYIRDKIAMLEVTYK